MRLVDSDALKGAIAEFHQKENDRLHSPLWGSIGLNALNRLIDNAPSVPLPDFKEGYKQAIIDGKTNYSRPQGEWVPVSERLPIRNGVYNVTRKLKEGETIYFISDANYFDGQNTWHRDTGVNHGRPYLTDIIAWQPLPEPYKKGGAK